MLDSFGQWALADWPRKLHNQEQLTRELAEEEKTFGSAADFGYGRYGGYKNTQAKATGFFRVEQIDGRLVVCRSRGPPVSVHGNQRHAGRRRGLRRQRRRCRAAPIAGSIPGA